MQHDFDPPVLLAPLRRGVRGKRVGFAAAFRGGTRAIANLAVDDALRRLGARQRQLEIRRELQIVADRLVVGVADDLNLSRLILQRRGDAVE